MRRRSDDATAREGTGFRAHAVAFREPPRHTRGSGAACSLLCLPRGVQYFEVSYPSSQEKVVTAFDLHDAVVFSVDYRSNVAHTQTTITVSGGKATHTLTLPETPASAESNGAGLRPQEMNTCGRYWRNMVTAYDSGSVTGDWSQFDHWQAMIIAEC